MGKRYRDLVSQHSKAKRSARSVINVMASWANDDGLCSKRIDGIAAECGLSLRSVQYAISTLIELGEIEVSESGIGRGNTPVYTLKHAIFAPFTPDNKSEKVQNSAEKVQKSEEKVQETSEKGANSASDTIYGSSIDLKDDPKEIDSVDDTTSRTTASHSEQNDSQSKSELEQTLALMAAWSKDKPKPVKTRLSSEQSAIVDAQLPTFDPPSRVQAATTATPTLSTASSISNPSPVRAVFGTYFPKKVLSTGQWRLIEQTVTELPKWIRVCERWLENYGEDWHKFGLLDWYRDGIPGMDDRQQRKEKFNGKRTGAITRNFGEGREEPTDSHSQYAKYAA